MLILLRVGLAAPEASECQPDVAVQLAKCPKQLLNSFFSFKTEVSYPKAICSRKISKNYRSSTGDGSFSPTCSLLMPIKRLSDYICINKPGKFTGTRLSHKFLARFKGWSQLSLALSRQHSDLWPMSCHSQWQFGSGHSALLEEESWEIWTYTVLSELNIRAKE